MPVGHFVSMERGPLVKRVTGANFGPGTYNTATAASGAATCNSRSGLITSEALTTAGLAAYTLTVTCDHAGADSVILVSLQQGTNTQGTLCNGTVTPAAGSFVVVIRNVHASQALNGTIKAAFFIFNPS